MIDVITTIATILGALILFAIVVVALTVLFVLIAIWIDIHREDKNKGQSKTTK